MRESGRNPGLRRLAPLAVAVAAFVGGCAGGGASLAPSAHAASATRAATPSPTPIPRAVFVAAGSTKTAHRNAVLLKDRTVLMVGGPDAFGRAIADTEIFDPKSGKYSAGLRMTSPRLNPTVTVLDDGRVLVTGGRDATTSVLASAEILDPASGMVVATGSMAVPRTEAVAFLLPTGDVLVLGGKDPNGTVLSSAEVYHTKTGMFTMTGPMLQPRNDYGVGQLLDGRVLVVGGCCTTAGLALTSAEVYDPATGSFQSAGSMAVGRSSPIVAVLGDGEVLIAGGNASPFPESTLDSAAIFDPRTLLFRPVGSMTTPRAGGVGIRMQNVSVLIVGGAADKSAEIFDPASESFKATASTIGARSELSTATLLPDGRVYIAGGGSGADATSAELYVP